MGAIERIMGQQQRQVKSVWAVMKIHSVGNMLIESGSRLVFIRDIASESMNFLTPLKFPVGNHYSLGFQILLPDRSLSVTGEVIWTRRKNSFNSYGVKLTMNDELRNELQRSLLDMQRQTAPKAEIYETYRQMSEWPVWKNRLDVCQ